MVINEALTTPVQNGHTNPTLELCGGQFLFRGVTEGGTNLEKLVSAAAVREAMTGIPVDSQWLTPNLAFGGVVRWGVKRGVEWAVLFLPPSVHNLELTEADGTPEESVSRVAAPLPGMVMFGVGTQYFVWAAKTERLDPYQELYRAPLPNVMADASVCWGAQKPPHATGKAVAEAWALFAYRTTFNNHAAEAKSKREPEDVRRVLRACAAAEQNPLNPYQQTRYPVDDLRRQDAENGLTLDKFVRNVLEAGELPG
jgi:Prokaryotic E2 family D